MLLNFLRAAGIGIDPAVEPRFYSCGRKCYLELVQSCLLRIVSVFLMKMIKIIILYDELGPEIKRFFEIECREKIAIPFRTSLNLDLGMVYPQISESRA
jgi:hypothetical protein